MLEQSQAERVVNAWLEVAESNRGTERFQISMAAFRSIVDGHMPSVKEIAAAIGSSVDDVKELVNAMAANGRLTIDESGTTITGAGGLSLVESRHRVDMLGRTYWVWCALDAVGIPAGLDADATVRSRCADTGESVEITITRGEISRSSPDDLVISLVPPTLDQSLHDCCCSEIGFYSSAENIPPPATPVTITRAMDLGRRLWRDGVPL
jgi:alkylmercury lyase